VTTPDTRLDEECTFDKTGYEGVSEGWVRTTLQELLDVLESGSRPKGGVRGISAGIPSIGGEHLNSDGSFDFDSIKYVPNNFFDRMNQGHIQVNDILVVKDGATTGKVSLVREDFPFKTAVVNEHVFICRPVKDLFSPFLFYFLFADEGQNRILENFRGSAQGGINHSFAAATTVPLAPTAEQKRIVAKIEELLPQVNVAKERLKRASRIIKRFRQAVLSAACTGMLTEGWRASRRESFLSSLGKHASEDSIEDSNNLPEDWIWKKLEDLSEYQGGYAFDSKEFVEQGQNQVVRIGNVKPGHLDLSISPVFIEDEYAHKVARFLLIENDLLISQTGTRYKRDYGFVGMVTENPKNLYLNQRVGRLRCKSSCLPQYLFYWLQTATFRDFYFKDETGNVNQGNVGANALKLAPVASPPVEEQREIVRRVEALLKLADAIEKRNDAAGIRADKLA
jgi:type I restriction enzyme S subunit